MNHLDTINELNTKVKVIMPSSGGKQWQEEYIAVYSLQFLKSLQLVWEEGNRFLSLPNQVLFELCD